MCGIAGSTISVDQARHMAGLLLHRGPDHQGIYSDAFVTLAHNRLSILDLSERANQPMTRGDLVLVYNGEIYNFAELRDELSRDGIRFETHSDTEVLLRMYQKHGRGCLEHLNGDFAFCIYHRTQKKLFCARDRVGNKPFYYSQSGGHFIFASELSAFDGTFPLEFNTQQLGDAVLFGINDHCENTVYKNISNLKPAHWLEYDLEKKSLLTGQYWNLPLGPDRDPLSRKKRIQKTDEFEALLESAVKLRLVADVPVGCLVSGGIDSSLIAALIARNHANVHFFHCDHPRYPTIREREHVETLARNCHFEVNYVCPDESDLKGDWPSLLWAQSDIFRSLSLYSQFATLKKARESVKVMIGGQGADELFGGYAHHLARFVPLDTSGFFYRIRLVGARQAARELWQGLKLRLPSLIKRHLFQKDNTTHLQAVNSVLHDYKPDWDLLLKKFVSDPRLALRQDTLCLSLPQLLRYEDRNAMAFGIENRTPFTDFRVIEFVHALPSDFLYHGGQNKFLLRELAKRLLPGTIACRADKKGFEAPDADWMKALGVQGQGLFDFRLFVFKELCDRFKH